MKSFLIKKRALYEGCGNKVLIIMLDSFDHQDHEFRKLLKVEGIKTGADSVMVLTGEPERMSDQGYHATMDVFEPRGKEINNESVGSWSTMCGNGIRAVARFLKDENLMNGTGYCSIKTASGIRTVEYFSDNKFKVNMGSFIDSKTGLSRYISDFDLNDNLKDIDHLSYFYGFNADVKNGETEGEPHLVLEIIDNLGFKAIESRLMENSEGIISDSRLFPEEINLSVVSKVADRNAKLIVRAATYERGVYYVTRACGTAATVVGSHFIKVDGYDSVEVKMPGGDLEITRSGNTYFMTGPANPVN